MPQDRRFPSPAPDAYTFVERHCTEIPTSTLSSDNQTCSICVTRYGEPSPEEEGERPEAPIQINFGDCHHVFGHRCFVKLIDSRQGWSNKCPLCRAHWFSTIEDLDAADLAGIILGIQAVADAMFEGITTHERELYDPHAYLRALVAASGLQDSLSLIFDSPRDRMLGTGTTRDQTPYTPRPSRLRRARNLVRDVYRRWREVREENELWERLTATTPHGRRTSSERSSTHDGFFRGADLVRERARQARSPREGFHWFEDEDRNLETVGYYISM